jgi:hypothetical protein
LSRIPCQEWTLHAGSSDSLAHHFAHRQRKRHPLVRRCRRSIMPSGWPLAIGCAVSAIASFSGPPVALSVGTSGDPSSAPRRSPSPTPLAYRRDSVLVLATRGPRQREASQRQGTGGLVLFCIVGHMQPGGLTTGTPGCKLDRQRHKGLIYLPDRNGDLVSTLVFRVRRRPGRVHL